MWCKTSQEDQTLFELFLVLKNEQEKQEDREKVVKENTFKIFQIHLREIRDVNSNLLKILKAMQEKIMECLVVCHKLKAVERNIKKPYC